MFGLLTAKLRWITILMSVVSWSLSFSLFLLYKNILVPKKSQEKLILFKGFLSLSVVKLELHIFINISSLFTWLAFWFSRIRSKNGTVVFCKHRVCCWFLLLSFVHSLYVCFLRLLRNKSTLFSNPPLALSD